MCYIVMDVGYGFNNISILQDDCGETLIFNSREDAAIHCDFCKLGIIVEIPSEEAGV
jgi:hypothetical protein